MSLDLFPVCAAISHHSFMCLSDFAFGILRRCLPEDKVESVQGLGITADQKGAVFDVRVNDLATFLAAGKKNAEQLSMKVVKTLPRLQERDTSKGRFGNARSGGGFSRGSGGSRGGGNNRFSDRRNNGFSRVRGRGRG